MILGSHNSFTYLKSVNLRLLAFTAKCLSVDIKTQYEKYGVRAFDLRVRFKNNTPIIAHGIIEYPYDESLLEYLNNKGNCYLRVLLEFNSKPKDYDSQLNQFFNYCKYILNKYLNIKMFGGRCKWDWHVIYDFKISEPTLDDKYSSTTKPLYLDDWWPWLYARLNNKKNKLIGTDKDCLFIDFVNI